MKVHHYAEGFGSIKVPIYCCNKKDCMFHAKNGNVCALFVPHIARGRCEAYSPIDKSREKMEAGDEK